MTSKESIPAIIRPVGVVIEQQDTSDWYVFISDRDDIEVCGFGDASESNKAQAHEIARAVNTFPLLVTALEAIVEGTMTTKEAYALARQALAAARGEL
jgi:hypothetical protein